MNKTDSMDEILIRYREGALESTEREVVERLISTNPEWKTAFRLHTSMELALGDTKGHEAMQKLDELWVQNHKRTQIRYYSLVAGLLIFITCGILLWYQLVYQQSGSRLYQKYYAVAALPDVYRIQGRMATENLNKAFSAYSNKKYSQALQLFNMMLKADTANTAVLLYAGICCMEEKRFEKSIQYFNKIIKWQDPAYEESALWYSGLAALTLGKTEECKKLMEELIVRKSYYSDKARDIISNL